MFDRMKLVSQDEDSEEESELDFAESFKELDLPKEAQIILLDRCEKPARHKHMASLTIGVQHNVMLIWPIRSELTFQLS